MGDLTTRPLPRWRRGRKVQVAWTSPFGRRELGTCWTQNLRAFITNRVMSGSTDVVLVRDDGRRADLGTRT